MSPLTEAVFLSLNTRHRVGFLYCLANTDGEIMDTSLIPNSIKKEKVTLGLLAVVAVLAYSWALATFITKAEAGDHLKTISQKMDENRAIITNHIDKVDLKFALEGVRSIRQDIYYLDRDDRELGVTSASEDRRLRLNNDLSTAILYRDCLVAKQTNCQDIAFTMR